MGVRRASSVFTGSAINYGGCVTYLVSYCSITLSTFSVGRIAISWVFCGNVTVSVDLLVIFELQLLSHVSFGKYATVCCRRFLYI
jgi:hypothetical protein